MKMTSERKIEVRDAAVAAAIFGALAAVSSWLLFVWAGDGARLFPFGALADWVAAAGTWAIGYGAWRVAREAHLHRVQEVDRISEHERSVARARLKDIRYRTTAATSVYGSLEVFLAMDSPVNFATTDAVLQVTAEGLGDADYGEFDRRLLDEVALEALASFRTDVRVYRSTVHRFADLVGVDHTAFDARTSPAFGIVLGYARDMEISGFEFVEECERLYRST